MQWLLLFQGCLIAYGYRVANASYVFLRLRLGYERIAYPYTLGFGIDSKWLLAGLLKLNIRIPLALTILKIMASRHRRPVG